MVGWEGRWVGGEEEGGGARERGGNVFPCCLNHNITKYNMA